MRIYMVKIRKLPSHGVSADPPDPLKMPLEVRCPGHYLIISVNRHRRHHVPGVVSEYDSSHRSSETCCKRQFCACIKMYINTCKFVFIILFRCMINLNFTTWKFHQIMRFMRIMTVRQCQIVNRIFCWNKIRCTLHSLWQLHLLYNFAKANKTLNLA